MNEYPQVAPSAAQKTASAIQFYLEEVFNPSLFPVAFRIEGDELVSSRGARVPIEAAKVALKFALKHRATGWHRNGSTCEVGYYQLDAINDQGIVAGCHRITWDEVERVATMLA